jgi:hypothetical protein
MGDVPAEPGKTAAEAIAAELDAALDKPEVRRKISDQIMVSTAYMMQQYGARRGPVQNQVTWSAAGGNSGSGGAGGGGGGYYAAAGGIGGSGGSAAPWTPVIGGGGGGGGAYAGGGLVVTPGGSGGAGGGGGFALPEFEHLYGARPEPPEIPVVPAAVTLYRWWTLPLPDLSKDPLTADEHWSRVLLSGARETWQPGVNVARCLSGGYGHPYGPDVVPSKHCSCGFWAYCKLQQQPLSGPESALQVCGVIKGFGRMRPGSVMDAGGKTWLGARVEKARIVALHLPYTLAPSAIVQAYRRLLDPYSRRRIPEFTGKVINIGTDHVPWPLRNMRPTLGELEEAVLLCETWMAVMSDRLEQMYPGVRVFETRDAMLATFPPDPVYGQRERSD